jgi:hypothetical protein
MEFNVWEVLSVLSMIALSIYGWTVVTRILDNRKAKNIKLNLGDKVFVGFQIFYSLYTLYNIGELVWAVVQ